MLPVEMIMLLVPGRTIHNLIMLLGLIPVHSPRKHERLLEQAESRHKEQLDRVNVDLAAQQQAAHQEALQKREKEFDRAEKKWKIEKEDLLVQLDALEAGGGCLKARMEPEEKAIRWSPEEMLRAQNARECELLRENAKLAADIRLFERKFGFTFV